MISEFLFGLLLFLVTVQRNVKIAFRMLKPVMYDGNQPFGRFYPTRSMLRV